MKKLSDLIKNSNLEKDDIVKLVDYYDDENFKRKHENSTSIKKNDILQFEKFNKLAEKVKNRRIREKEIESELKKLLKEKKELLKDDKNDNDEYDKYFEEEPEDNIMIKESYNKLNKMHTITIIPTKNFDFAKTSNGEPEPINLFDYVQRLKNTDKLPQGNPFFLNILTDSGYKTLKVINDIDELDDIERIYDDFVDDYKMGTVYGVSVAFK
jgi:HD superfamily phosphohydrolase